MTKLLLCYISGLDLRRINENTTPFIHSSLKLFPNVKIRNYPGNDLLPSILTGAYPQDHGMWGVKIKDSYYNSNGSGFLDILPDFITTTGQCLAHLITKSFDLAAIPPRRRKHFDLKRTKYLRRSKLTDALLEIGNIPSCLKIIGRDRSRYIFDNNPAPTEKLLKEVGTGQYALEILELYTLDLIQQWNLDSVNRINTHYSQIDTFIRDLNGKCNDNDVVLSILSDHGHEMITGSINLKQKLKNLDINENEYNYFLDISIARFWFRTERARQGVTEILHRLENSHMMSSKDLIKYNLVFNDTEYGEIFSFLEPGYIFFPNDFYQPIANLYFAITDRRQRSRLVYPAHRGTHGYLPEAECENAFMVILNDKFKTKKERIEIIDVAPSLLDILGFGIPGSMKGRPCFTV